MWNVENEHKDEHEIMDGSLVRLERVRGLRRGGRFPH